MPNLNVLPQAEPFEFLPRSSDDIPYISQEVRSKMAQPRRPLKKVTIDEYQKSPFPTLDITLSSKFKTPSISSQPEEKTLTVMREAVSDESIEDSLPLHKRPLVVPMPYFPIDVNELGPDEFRNAGSMLMEALYARAKDLLQKNSNLFAYDHYESGYLPPLEECLGVMFQLTRGPVLFDKSTIESTPDAETYRMIVYGLDASYEPIYVITKESAYPVSAEKYLETYKDIFGVIDLDEEETTKNNSEH